MGHKDDNHCFRENLHSYALARIMYHLVGYENFEDADHAAHEMLIEDTRTHIQQGNFRDRLEGKIKSRKELMIGEIK